MQPVGRNGAVGEATAARTDALFREHRQAIFRQTDRLFAGLLVVQWAAGVACAIWISPRAWEGLSNHTHPHVWAAFLLGGVIVAPPILLALTRPGRASTRHAVAVGQMLWSALLIHLTGGRIESHFHVFGSLAFLAFYRDWRVLLTASAVVAVDHFLRGTFWPESVFGVLTGGGWRWLEHAGWVVFEDVFLVYSCVRGVAEMRGMADRQARLEAVHAGVEATVLKRTEELRHAQGTLDQLRQRHGLILEAAGEGIYGLDLDGNTTFVNAAASAMLGWRPEELVGRPMHPLLHHTRADGAPYPREECPIYAAFRDGTTRRVAGEVFWRKDGASFPVEYVSTPIFEDGRLTGAVVLFCDASRRLETERRLREAKEAAEAASRAKSEFLANMSHEIRTPMNGVLGMIELTLGTDLQSEQREFLQTAQGSAEALLTVINDVLDFSKIEAGKLELNAAPLDVRETAGDALKTLAVRAHEKGLELNCRVSADVPGALAGDAGRLRQVILNLVGNAVKFTGKGEVTLDVSVESREEGAVVLHFAAADTGVGIPAEKLRLIFDPFSQADGSTTRKYGGTGLGLTISSRLVERMGGRIWVESEVGRGSTFHFTARLDRPRGASPSTALLSVSELRGLAALVVDDNATNRRILEETLRAWGMRPASVDGGAAALAELKRAAAAGEAYPLVLLDAQMPEMDGFALAERIRREPALAGSTVMMLTSLGHQGDAGRCRELGLASYLVKPVKQSELLRAVLSVLGTALARTPRPAGPGRVGVPPLALAPTAGRLRVLLAEDNAVNRLVAVRMLEKQGHAVAVACDGRQALDALSRERFDLALLDIQMPELDGFEVASAVRAREAGADRRLPLVALTAHAMEGDRERCLAAGMDGYVSKPIQLEQLTRVMEEVLAGDKGRVSPAPELAPFQRA